MRLSLATAALILASGATWAQDANVQIATDQPIVIVEEDAADPFGPVGDFTVNFGRPTTFDSLRLDVRESLRPPGSFGPGNPMGCSPSVPDC